MPQAYESIEQEGPTKIWTGRIAKIEVVSFLARIYDDGEIGCTKLVVPLNYIDPVQIERVVKDTIIRVGTTVPDEQVDFDLKWLELIRQFEH
jgi:hypothetical protein